MNDVAVKVQNLGKLYRIGVARVNTQATLTETVGNFLANPFRSSRISHNPASSPADHIWALRHVSFEVPRGQILGIIGPNGAGKSTLLKILSRITEPTEGRVDIRGRVASLLEVGTGFHPELTGRENVYLGGAFLGMRRAEVDRKLEEIIDFSGVKQFVETPVKYYSSGMYVRLAFAVAAHLEPDILIVDEVLAVGDVSFQRKCLAKMEDVRQHGRTILFVSHNIPAITRLCERAILIAGGSIDNDGPAAQVGSAYMLSSLSIGAERTWPDPVTAPGNEVARLVRARVCTVEGQTVELTDLCRSLVFEMVYDVLKPGWPLAPWCEVFADSGLCLFTSLDMPPGWRDHPRTVGRFTSSVVVPANLLAEGTFLIGFGLYSPEPEQNHFHLRDAVAVQVTDRADGRSARGDWVGPVPGVVRPMLSWTTAATPGNRATDKNRL
jgi:homopolymeric O-antigen transport system ATP-binding protein